MTTAVEEQRVHALDVFTKWNVVCRDGFTLEIQPRREKLIPYFGIDPTEARIDLLNKM